MESRSRDGSRLRDTYDIIFGPSSTRLYATSLVACHGFLNLPYAAAQRAHYLCKLKMGRNDIGIDFQSDFDFEAACSWLWVHSSGRAEPKHGASIGRAQIEIQQKHDAGKGSRRKCLPEVKD